MKKRIGPKKRCCLECHFLKQWMRDKNGETYSFETSLSQRTRLAAGENPKTVLLPDHSLACHQQVWDTANFREDSDKNVQGIVTAERGESCFFFPRTPGMFFLAAAKLEHRVADRREAERDRFLTRRAFYVAFGALIVSIVATIANIVIQLVK